MSDLHLHPVSVKESLRFCRAVHRWQPKLQGALWAAGIYTPSAALVGVAIIAWPARLLAKQGVLSVARVAVIEHQPNGCSMLYGSCARAAKALGATGLVTYTHLDEPGTSLIAAGWVSTGLTDGGEWDRPSRPRARAVDAQPKRRWWAPWSAAVVRLPGGSAPI